MLEVKCYNCWMFDAITDRCLMLQLLSIIFYNCWMLDVISARMLDVITVGCQMLELLGCLMLMTEVHSLNTEYYIDLYDCMDND